MVETCWNSINNDETNTYQLVIRISSIQRRWHGGQGVFRPRCRCQRQRQDGQGFFGERKKIHMEFHTGCEKMGNYEWIGFSGSKYLQGSPMIYGFRWRFSLKPNHCGILPQMATIEGKSWVTIRFWCIFRQNSRENHGGPIPGTDSHTP